MTSADWKVTDYSFFAEVTHYYSLKRETPTHANNLTASERRLLKLGRLSWRELEPTPPQQAQAEWRQQARGPKR